MPTCHLCPTLRHFSYPFQISQHLNTSHNYCPFCRLSFPSSTLLDSHRYFRSDIGSREVEIRESGCATWRGEDCLGEPVVGEERRRTREDGEGRVEHWFCAGLNARGERCGRGFGEERAFRQVCDLFVIFKLLVCHRCPPCMMDSFVQTQSLI
ncbi:hypothetical protein BT69DRAFT_681211 [Atractiella rhizophila]|nr:hypothetical protein BT69DRAFT_681211 [Atractiella rhizophila]